MLVTEHWPELSEYLVQARLHQWVGKPIELDDTAYKAERWSLRGNKTETEMQKSAKAIVRVLVKEERRKLAAAQQQEQPEPPTPIAPIVLQLPTEPGWHIGLRLTFRLAVIVLLLLILFFVALPAQAQRRARFEIQDEGSRLLLCGGGLCGLNYAGAGVVCAPPIGNIVTCTITGGGATGYDTIQDEGAALTQRTILNLIGAGVNCVDNAPSTRTDCTISGGGGASLDAITAAVAAATINSGDNAIVWNWSLTTASKSAFTFGENVASVAITDPILINIQTLAASTAHPVQVTARGTTDGVRVGATDGVVVALGTGGLDWPALLNYPSDCVNQLVRGVADTLTCAAVTSTDTSGTFPADAHNLLSTTHGDTLAATVVRGDFAIGNVTPAWSRLALGGANLYPKSDGTDVVYSTLAAGGVGSCTNRFVRALNADAAPTCATIILTADVTETLPVGNGGTGTPTAFTLGSIVFAGASGVYAQDNANFFWHDINNRLGIGTSAPDNPLSIVRTLNALADLAVEQNYHLKLQNTNDIDGQGVGISFGMSSADDQQTGAIVARRTGSNGQGTLQFYTKQSTLTGVAPALVLALDENGNAGIGVESPAISALLELFSTTKAFLPTRLTTANRDALTAVDGMVLYNSTLARAQGRVNAAWVSFLGPATTDTLTNKALDAEATGNALGTVSKIYIDASSCIGATATLNLDDAGTGDTAPTAACNDTGSIQRPSADFSGSAVNTFERTIRLPSDWASGAAVDVSIRYVTVAAAPTGNVEWDISTVCRAVGESWDGTFNAIQTITDAVGAQNALNDADQASVTMTGCAADEDWTLKISRDGTNDTNNDLAKMMGVMITLRRTQ